MPVKPKLQQCQMFTYRNIIAAFVDGPMNEDENYQYRRLKLFKPRRASDRYKKPEITTARPHKLAA